jgi:hypothetical protein
MDVSDELNNLHLQIRRTSQVKKASSKKIAEDGLRYVPSVQFYQATLRHIPGGSTLHSQRLKKLISYVSIVIRLTYI